MINIDLSVPETEVVPEGMYKVRVERCVVQPTKAKDRNMVVVTLSITNPPSEVQFPAPIMEFFVLPNASDLESEPDKAANFVRSLKRFLVAMKIKHTAKGFNPQFAIQSTGTVHIGLEEGQDKVIRNKITWPKFTNA